MGSVSVRNHTASVMDVSVENLKRYRMPFSQHSPALRLYKLQEFIERAEHEEESFRSDFRIFFIRYPIQDTAETQYPGTINESRNNMFSSQILLGPISNIQVAKNAAKDYVIKKFEDTYVIIFCSSDHGKK